LPFLTRPQKETFFRVKPQRSEPTDIIDREEKIERIKGSRVDCLPGALGFLSTFCVIPLDHASPPTVGLRIGNRAMKGRPVTRLSVKLRACDELQGGINRERILARQPTGVIDKSRAFPASSGVIMKHAEGVG